MLRRLSALCLLCTSAALSLTGCDASRRLMHNLQPHRLQQWNRGEGPSDSNISAFSVRDPIEEVLKERQKQKDDERTSDDSFAE